MSLISTVIDVSGLEIADCDIARLQFFQKENRLVLELHTDDILSFHDYAYIMDALKDSTGAQIDLHVHADNQHISNIDLRKYFDYLYDSDQPYAFLKTNTFTYDANNKIVQLLFHNEKDVTKAQSYLEDIESFFKNIGCDSLHFDCSMIETGEIEHDVVKMAAPPEEVKPAPKTNGNGNGNGGYRRRRKKYDPVKIKDIEHATQGVEIEGTVFGVEYRTRKNSDFVIQTGKIFDGSDAIEFTQFESEKLTKEMLEEIKDGSHVVMRGNFMDPSRFNNDITFRPDEFEVVKEKPIEKDMAEEKRLEFHMHTNMSEMDGVCDIKSIVDYFYQIGHRGFVLTDHANVQSFVKAFNAAQAIAKKDPERNFKVGLGCEMNLANDALKIVYNQNDALLNDQTYIVFDLETTGLSCYFDHIIEFGAIKMKNSSIVERKQMFIKPPVSIPSFISSKTNITNDMVKDAKSFAEVSDELVEWIGDGVLVAHNASFDYNFFNEELKRCGKDILMNPVIDTLDLSRAILRERRQFRLGNVARHYRIAYDEEVAHRADYDAEVLSSVFSSLLQDAAKKYDCETLSDLQNKCQDETSFAKVRRSHICVIAKNLVGLKALYKMVSTSNTKTLAIMGKASKEGGDTAVEPRVLRSMIAKHRENLLLGSACLNGEVFELACSGNDAQLEEAMSFYDYIELQPLSNYSIVLTKGEVPTLDRLKDVIRRIIKMAKKLNKPVIADSDAHYCTKEQKIYRDVYITALGVGGVIHPLYIRNEAVRLRSKNPDQHIRYTNEMLEEFAWLEDPDYIKEIVIDNPNKIFDELEVIRPVPDGVFPPKIEGSNDKLKNLCLDKAKAMYEFEGVIPEEVSARLNRELDAIIRAGYAVNYYISHLLIKKSNEDGYVVGSRGSVGSSFTATMANITEVNPLQPHYRCDACNYTEWFDPKEIKSGFDLPDKECPHCHAMMKGDGHNIPFETFLGFHGEKVPDIDLNFSGDYQATAHAFTRDVFGVDHAFRAGTISGVQEKTAFGYVEGYCEKMGNLQLRRPYKEWLASKLVGVKRTSGQHAGGIIIVPEDYEVEDFTPIQYPANNPNSSWLTTHYDFHDIHDNVLKFDILGHVDPTAMKLLGDVSEMDPLKIPMNDPETLSIFHSDDALKADTRIYKREIGTLGLPEFGTGNTRRMLEETRPKSFSDLVIISGLAHGTNVWENNAQKLVKDGMPLQEVIGCRDDIMSYLIEKEMDPSDAFNIMECVRKGKGLTPEQESKMREKNVPDWYINSCKLIAYMFPKAHAVAYVMMGVRVAWYKVHDPLSFYIQFLSLRCDAYEIETMIKGIDVIRQRMEDINTRSQRGYQGDHPASNKEKSLIGTLEICEELYARGFEIGNIDIEQSKGTQFIVDKDNPKRLIAPFIVLDGLGEAAAISIEKARDEQMFLSKEDMLKRTQMNGTSMKVLEKMGCLSNLQDTNQMSLF